MLAFPKEPGAAEDGCAKLDELEQLIGEIIEQGGAKVLVFSEWTEMLRLASTRLDRMGVPHELLHGGVPTEKRPALLARFAEDPEQRVLLSTDAGGVGLNLQAASYVVHLDLPWNPARLDQRTSRAHRMGQTRGVSVTCLCASSGIEKGIEGTLAGKRSLRSAALDPDSEVDSLDAPSFTAFLNELQSVMASVDAGADVESSEATAVVIDSEIVAEAAPVEPAALVAESPPLVAESSPLVAESSPVVAESPQSPALLAAAPPPTPTPALPRAAERLRLAEVVLTAGFSGDAVRAAYDALAAQLRHHMGGAIGPDHAALVAAAYRDLVPSGRAPEGLLGALARLRDLTLLETYDVPVDPALAAVAVAEARAWVERLAAAD